MADAFEKTAVDTSRFPPEVTEVYRHAALRPGAMRSMLNYYRALFRGLRKTASEELPVIETPTLMLWGLEDTALSKETTDGTDEYVTDLTLRFLPDVSHWVQQDAPETVNAMLLAWLADEPVPEAADVVFERLEDLAVSRTTVTTRITAAASPARARDGPGRASGSGLQAEPGIGSYCVRSRSTNVVPAPAECASANPCRAEADA